MFALNRLANRVLFLTIYRLIKFIFITIASCYKGTCCFQQFCKSNEVEVSEPVVKDQSVSKPLLVPEWPEGSGCPTIKSLVWVGRCFQTRLGKAIDIAIQLISILIGFPVFFCLRRCEISHHFRSDHTN